MSFIINYSEYYELHDLFLDKLLKKLDHLEDTSKVFKGTQNTLFTDNEIIVKVLQSTQEMSSSKYETLHAHIMVRKIAKEIMLVQRDSLTILSLSLSLSSPFRT